MPISIPIIIISSALFILGSFLLINSTRRIFSSFIVAGAGLIGIIIGIVNIALNAFNAAHGPNKSDPESSVRAYFNQGLFTSNLVSYSSKNYSNPGRAWGILSAIAKKNFSTFEAFGEYCKQVVEDIMYYTGKACEGSLKGYDVENWEVYYRMDVEDFTFVQKENMWGEATYNLVVSRLRYNFGSSNTDDGHLVEYRCTLSQRKALGKVKNNWYITSGRIDLPAQWIKKVVMD